MSADALCTNPPYPIEGTTMNILNINAIALAVGLACSTGVMAQDLSKSEYRAGKDSIAAEYKLARETCDSFSGNSKDICTEKAEGNKKAAKAELKARYKPTAENHYEAGIARAEANYGAAKEKCDSLDGNTKDVCVKEAKAVKAGAKVETKAQFGQ